MKNLSAGLTSIMQKGEKLKTIYKPLFIKPGTVKGNKELKALLKLSGLTVCDTISDQLREFIKTSNPSKKFTAAQMDVAVKKHLRDTSIHNYGVWVYYPWSNRLVHLLDKKEFVKVRTSRNQYKITANEQAAMATKKIGVVGLSVGQSVSVTLAMERICGEIRLADFDVLELTNLNRIRTGVHNLNLPKVYSVAREIAEIDPFIKVKCFPKGLTEKNMHGFFMQGGKLDIMVEESDGFDIKILSRIKARELKIPVIMEASDRCMVDVERFDLEPERNILHGLVNHLDIKTLKSLKTTEEKIPYMLDVLGLETSSLRLRASMLEIEQTINTWPQLASAVTMGGGIAADVCRRVLLGQFTDSGRYHVDIEELIGNKQPAAETIPAELIPEFNFIGVARTVNLPVQENQANPSPNQISEIVAAGCKAPSGGNSQPWRWVYKQQTLLLFNPFEPGSTLLDYNGLASLIAIGAAIENVTLRAAAFGLDTGVEYFPEGEKSRLTAAMRFFEKKQGDLSFNKTRCEAINFRMTNRNISEREEIDPNALEALINVARETEGANLHFITEPQKLDIAGNLLGELEKIRLLEKTGHRDFVNEMRWSAEEAERTMDGVDLRTIDLTNAELAGLKIAKKTDVINLVAEWGGGGAFKKLTKKTVDAAGAIGVLTMKGNSRAHYINAGRALGRVWLEVNSKAISLQPVSACLFLYARLLQGGGQGISKNTCTQLQKLRGHFEAIFLNDKNLQEMFIFRLSKSRLPEVRSLRKPLKDLFCYF